MDDKRLSFLGEEKDCTLRKPQDMSSKSWDRIHGEEFSGDNEGMKNIKLGKREFMETGTLLQYNI